MRKITSEVFLSTAPEQVRNSSRLGPRFVTAHKHCAGLAGTVSPSSDCINIPVIDGSVAVRSRRDRRLLRCSVLPALGALIPPAILHRMPPGRADKTVSRKVLGRFGIGRAFAFLVFVFVVLIFAVFAFLAFALYPLVLGNSQTASS